MTTSRMRRAAQKLQRKTLPEPKPDMTGWTYMERVTWEVQHRGLQEMVRESNQGSEWVPPEVWDAEDANDAAILAERAAKAAAERLAERPGSAVAQINARATRAAADKAARAAEQARRIAEEAKLRPPPAPKPEPEAQAPTVQSAPKPASDSEPKPKRPHKRREAGMPKPQKQWWEERAKWRKRTAEEEADLRRGHPLYRCLVDYDPIEYFLAQRRQEQEDE